MSFGAELRTWRTRRRLSQMALALEAGASPRHLSFLETGRARPSVTMVSRLGEALNLSLSARTGLMAAAGFAAPHPRSDLSAEHLHRVSGAMARVVDRHDPWPGFAVDGAWRLLRMNAGMTRLLAPLGLSVGDSILVPFTHPGFGRRSSKTGPTSGTTWPRDWLPKAGRRVACLNWTPRWRSCRPIRT